MKEIPKVKHCPFCGAVAVLETNGKRYELKVFHKHECYMASLEPRRHVDPLKLIGMWNRRCG